MDIEEERSKFFSLGKIGRTGVFSIKKRLQKGELMVGTMISELRNPNIAFMLAQCGFNFFIID